MTSDDGDGKEGGKEGGMVGTIIAMSIMIITLTFYIQADLQWNLLGVRQRHPGRTDCTPSGGSPQLRPPLQRSLHLPHSLDQLSQLLEEASADILDDFQLPLEQLLCIE